MQAIPIGRETRPRVSPMLTVLFVLVSSIVLVFAGEIQSNMGYRTRTFNLALLSLACCIPLWLISQWRPRLGAWLTVLGLSGLVLLGDRWLALPGFLTLLAVPTALSVFTVGLPGAFGVAVAETVLLAFSWRVLGGPDATVALLVVWALLGLLFALYRSVEGFSNWTWSYYEYARHTLEEAQDRQAELNRALDDLEHANLQLTRLNLVSQRLRQVAEDARRAKQEFVANVSHELRTPLNMIVGFCEMILQAPEIYGNHIPTSLFADLKVINRNAEHLTRLVDDVLDLSQIEAGQMALTKEYVAVDEIVHAAVTAVRPLYQSKGLYLRTDVQDDLPPLFGDRTRLLEVLLNLLSNAGRFTHDGGVELRAWEQGGDLRVSVADTGTGIAAEKLDKLFQPFYQLDGSIRRRYGGTGLGLSISKQFIELHDGTIWVESQEGEGTTFFIRIPLTFSTPMDGGFSRWLSAEWEYLGHPEPPNFPKPVVRPRFVVLETGNTLQRLVDRHLEGVDVVSVRDWEGALRELAENPCQGLLVNDISVSGALENVDSRTIPYDIPVMICSVPGVSQAAGALGVSDYLVKPVSREDLLSALETLDLDGRTVLFVDDESDTLRLFRRMLVSSGQAYRVLRATDGQMALHMMIEHRPDVIFLDLAMPNMDGFQFLDLKSQEPACADIPVVVISARDPAGQPIVSNALTVTCQGGLSVQRLLNCIAALSEVLAPAV